MIAPRSTIRLIAVAGAVFAFGIAGLQQGTGADAAAAAKARPVTVKVVLRDFTVSMSRHNLPVRTPIRFVITNRGKAEHEAVLGHAGAVDEALEVQGREYEADDIAPGSTRTVTWMVPRAGTYQLACHMPGHFQMGMKTLFSVRSR